MAPSTESEARGLCLAVLLLPFVIFGPCNAVFDSNWTGVRNLPTPISLQKEYEGVQKGLSFEGSGTALNFHWVVTSCNLRPEWAKSLTYTLLHGLLHGMTPTTISVAWCKHYDPSQVPSELYNLRMSKDINVFFVPDDLKVLTPLTTYITALGVPEYLGRPDLPLLVTEDDVVFTLDFQAKLADISKQILATSKGRPYIASLYTPRYKVAPVNVILKYYEEAKKQGKHSPRSCQVQGKCPRNNTVFRSPYAYSYASLAMYYSPVATKYLRMHFIQIYYGDGGYVSDSISPDVLIHIFCRYRFKCSRSSHCELYRAVPAMVEHTGVFSAIRNAGNQRFHTTANFPFDIAFPLVQPLSAKILSAPDTPDTGAPAAGASLAGGSQNQTVKNMFKLF